MSTHPEPYTAQALLLRFATDEAFRTHLTRLQHQPEALTRLLHEEGYRITPEAWQAALTLFEEETLLSDTDLAEVAGGGLLTPIDTTPQQQFDFKQKRREMFENISGFFKNLF